MTSSRRYWWLAGAVLIALTAARMTQRAMFVDGMVYASIARNLSQGFGSVWAPWYSATAYPAFYEHPPFGFLTQSAAFFLLGDHLVVERLYSLAVFGLTAVAMTAIWRRFLPARYSPAPMFFWVLPSIVTWAVINNMLENTQTCLTTASVWALVAGGRHRSRGAAVGWAIAAGLLAIWAVLVKGPVGFFPLAVPALFVLLPLEDRPPHAGAAWAALLLTAGLAVGALAAFEAPRHAIGEYLAVQLLPSIEGRRGADVSRSGIFRHLGLGVMARMAVMLAIMWLVRRRGVDSGRAGRAPIRLPAAAWFFLAVGLSASLPLAIAPRFAGHYFLPSVPFFALGAAALALPALETFGAARRSVAARVPTVLAALLLAAAVIVPVVHGPIEPRDVDIQAQIDALAGTIPRGATLGGCPEGDVDWRLRAYLQRFFRVSLDPRGVPANGWFLQHYGLCAPPVQCRRVAGEPDLVLYQCDRDATPATR